MPQDTTYSGVKSKSSDAAGTGSNIKVIRREQPKMTRGQMIMAIADKMFPALMEFFKDKRNVAGMLPQPAHIRGIALNIAQDLVKNRELKENQ